jgi:transposase
VEPRQLWRPTKSEIAEAQTWYRGRPKHWIKARLRVLSALQEFPRASEPQLAKRANVKLETVENLFRVWQEDGMKQALEGFGRPRELSKRDMLTLRQLLMAGELQDLEAVQKWISRDVLQLEAGEVVSLAKAKALYRKALGIERSEPEYAVSAKLIKDLELRRPGIARALSQIVKKRISVRRAASEYGGDESTLRYYLRKAAMKRETGYVSRAFLSEFYNWCDRQEHVTVEGVRRYLGRQVQKAKSERSIHRYIQNWKDSRGVRRRHWTCGGSKWR